MPFVTAGESTRRDWLRRIGAGAVFFRATSHAATAESHWALLSDTHIPADPQNQYRGFFPQENLNKILPGLTDLKADGIAICGDLARLEGLAADYDTLKRLLEPVSRATPVAMALGNHDNRANFLSSFKDSLPGQAHALRDRFITVIERAPVRFVILDSLLFTNQVPGLLGKAQRAWLEEYLAKPSPLPAVLFVHHTLDDKDDALLDADRFLRLAAKHRDVKAVFYGHSHAYAFDKLEGVHLVNLPATGYNFRDSEPVGWVDARFHPAGVHLTLRAIAGNKAQDGKTVSLNWR